MNVTYFPGCTLRTKAKQLDFYARECAKVLGFSLCEPQTWQCCGGVFSSAKDEIASKLPGVRALIAAREAESPLLTVCSACYNVLKQTNAAMCETDFADRVNRYMTQDKNPAAPYRGETKVYHYLEYLRDVIGFDKVRAAVKNPLTGRKIGAYYGCMLLRPGKVLQFDDVENPRVMEDLLRALGAEPVIFAERNECCGGYVMLEDASASEKKAVSVGKGAAGQGAEELITACPLCRYNLIRSGSPIKVTYFTELLAEAFGLKEDGHAE